MTAGYLVTLAALLASAFITYRSAQTQFELEKTVSHTYQVMSHLRNVRSAISEAESGQRGFVITGRPEYLREYERNVERTMQDLEAVAGLTADNPHQQGRVPELQAAIEERVAIMGQPIAARRAGSFNTAQSIVSSGTGRHLMAAIHAGLAAMENEENRLLDRRRSEAARGRKTFLVSLAVGSLAGVLLLSGLFLFIRKLFAVKAARLRDEARHLSELEGKVQERTAELSALNQNLESFSYSVSHDLRGPLRSIGSQAAILEEDFPDLTPDQAAGLGRIRQGVKRMGSLMDDLLKLSRSTRGELRREEVDVGEIARQALAEIASRHPRTDITTVVADDLRASADPSMVTILFDNLIRNAWKYSAKTPKAVIEVGKENGAFFVRDNGLGFDDSQFEDALEPFRRLESGAQFEGSGIGLSICNRVVQRHGGLLWAKSQPGHGATIFFTLSGEP